jgi:hypothetical protein
VGSAGAGVVAVKVHAVFFATALSKRVVMVAGERGEYGDLQSQSANQSFAPRGFKIGAAAARTREHPLVIGGKTGGMTDALQRPQNMLVCAGLMDA